MATKTALMREEKLYECEVKRRRVRQSGKGYEAFWKVKVVREALVDSDTEFRCKDCHGAVKLFNKHVEHGPAPHVEHKVRADSEYCPAGMYFKQSSDGRAPRLSSAPVF